MRINTNMETLKYTVIKTKTQYKAYTKALETLVEKSPKTKSVADEIDLLTLLIETWDEAHNTFEDQDPIQLLKSLMQDYGLKATDLGVLLNMSKGYVSDMLNYKKGLSKDVIRILAQHFKLSQEAFNRPYKLVATTNVKRARVVAA